MPSPRASSSYSRVKESGGGPTRPASRRARMCSTTSRCSITQSVATATTTGYRRSSSSGDTSTRSQVSREVGSIQFVATLETLLTLTRACARKPPLTSRANGKQVDRDRIQDFCRYCGSPTELAAYANGRLESDPDETLQFSSQYCSLHRPKLPDGGWNPEHQRARRSAAQFDAELERLTRQAGNWRGP